MKILSARMLILIVGILLTGCENEIVSEKETLTKMNIELGILTKLISLPKQPVKVLWEVDEKQGNDNSSLVALLAFTKDDYAYIVSNSPMTEAKINDLMDIDFYEKWVPAQIQDAIKTENREGSYELMGIKRLLPELFTQAKLSPFKNGSVTPLGQGYVLISLYTM